MNEEMNANQKLKKRRNRIALLAALVSISIHGIAWVLWPPMETRPYIPMQRKSISIENVKTEDYNIPPPPEEEKIDVKDIPKQNVELKVTGDGPKISADDISDQGSKSTVDLNKGDDKKDAKPPVQKPKLVPPSEGQARILNKVKPRYPAAAAARGFEGQTVILITVGGDGKVDKVQIIKPSGDNECDQAAITAIKASTFRPYTFGGKPYPFQFTYIVDWKLIK
ncbi:MAG: TonB family protein [Candidatus Coatesbacteria bacterium]|nr:TonB family protein [Candidatus Coatesbacteria bacterium]